MSHFIRHTALLLISDRKRTYANDQAPA